MQRKFLFFIVGTATALFGGLIGASAASAHNTFTDSAPRDGEVLDASPTTWTVAFEKSVPLDSASGSIIDGAGGRISLPAPQHGANDRTIVFALPPNLNGAISARWRLVSIDGHVISGRVAFTVQAGPSATPPPTEATIDGGANDSTDIPDPIRVALRFANFASIVVLGGLLFIEFDIASGAIITRRGRKFAQYATGILVATPIAQYLIFANDINGGQESYLSAISDSLSLTAGGMLFLRIVAGLTLAWLVSRLCRTADTIRPLTIPIGIVSAAYLVSLAYVGHSRSQSAPMLGVPVDVVHTAAISVWLGGLTILVMVVVPSVDATSAVAAFSRFGFVAQRAVVIIVFTGVIQSVRLHGNPVNLLSSAHGLLLIAKVVIVALMIRLAARNRETLRRHHTASLANSERSRDFLLRATTTEILLGFGVLAITSILVAVTPG